MAFTYDPSTTPGVVRLLISDTAVDDPDRQVFTDSEIDVFLVLHANPKRAAALALDTIAADLAMVLRVIKTQDLSTDGAKTADALRRQAQALRDQADRDEDDTDGGLAIIDFDPWAGYRPCP